MSQTIDEKISHDILKGFVIPPRPQIVADIQIEAADPEPDINAIANLINQDAGITGSVIKAINSPFFGLAGKIKSVSHAVSLMGVDSVVNIVTALSLKQALSDESITNMNRFWDSATDVSNAAIIVSKYLQLGSRDDAYFLGLFHDCGIPLMMMKYTDYLSTLEKGYQDSAKRITDFENEAYKTDHAVLGYYTAKAWKVPEAICSAISDHHNVDKVFILGDKDRGEKKDLLAVLKIAEHICATYKTLGSASEDFEWESIKSGVLEYAGIVEDDILNMSDECKDAGIV